MRLPNHLLHFIHSNRVQTQVGYSNNYTVIVDGQLYQ
jgi:hypothetical protein